MIDTNKVQRLFDTISNDLAIPLFQNETDSSFRNRLVYSLVGRWILNLFQDRDFEEGNNCEVSKSHVTITAVKILKSFRKIDQNLSDYFENDLDFVNFIEDSYIRLGYIRSSFYSFKLQDKKAKIRIANKCLIIDNNTKIKKMRGIGIWGSTTENDIDLCDFLPVNLNAEEYTRRMISNLDFFEANLNHGNIEIYNISKNRWDNFSNKLLLEFPFSIIKVDDGLDYKIIKHLNGEFFEGSINSIFSKQGNDFIFKHEVWRVILGICSLNNVKAKCYLSKKDDYMKIRFKGFILPSLEEAILMSMCWPLKKCLSIGEYITDCSMEQAVIELLKNLCIDIVEEAQDGK